MVVIYLDKNRRCFPYSKLRTSKGAELLALDANLPSVQKMLTASGISGFNGSGINILGNGVNLFGSGALIEKCMIDPEKLKEDYLVVRGEGIGSNFKKAGNKIISWGKKNVLPLMRAGIKKAVESGKHIGADVLAETAPHLATIGAQAIDKKYGDSIIGNVAQRGLAELGKTVQKSASDYAKSQNPYSTVENRIADEIRQRSIARLQQELKKNDTLAVAKASPKGKGVARATQDQVMY